MAKQSGNAKGENKSALKKLRSALSSAGLTGPKSQITKRDKKRGVHKANNIKTSERRHKLRAIQTALNPFEMKVNRKKLDVLGLKRKDDTVNVAVARQRAVEKRKTTIGEERRNRSRLGGMVDRRIGENDPTMDPEEKMLQRFTAERQKRARNSTMFNLDDNSDIEGEITSLTHFGQSINDMKDFDFNGSGDEFEEGNGAISKQDVAAVHFGGFEPQAADGSSERKKTKAEVMQEIITKSKMHKHERQMAKEQDEDIRRELDDDFESVRALLFADNDNTADKPMMKAAAGGHQEGVDRSYDTVMRELVFEKRARPQDRLKTEEEAAREEKDRLERAERHRKRRMDDLDSDTEVDSDDDDDDNELKGYKTANKRRAVADDLGDDFAPAGSDDDDVDHTLSAKGLSLGAGLATEQSSDEDEEEDDDDNSDEEEVDGDSDEEEDAGSSDDEEDDDSELSGGEAEREEFKQKVSKATAVKKPTANSNEIPFTFSAPADYEAWLEIVSEYSLEQQLVVIRRLRTLYHIRLSPQNKEKLSNLCIILAEHLAVLAEQDPPVPAAVVDEIVKHIGELAAIDAERFGEFCRQAVVDCHRRVTQAIRASASDTAAQSAMQRHGPSASDHGVRASDIALMRVFVSVFSSSDRYHTVITPMLVSICQYLSQYTFTTMKDIAGGLVLTGLLHETQRLSRRLVPEALNFLFATLAASVCSTDDASDWDGQFPLSRRQRQAYQILRITVAEKCHSRSVEPIRWSWLVSSENSGVRSLTADPKYSVLRACLLLSRRFIGCYFSQSAFIECFMPLKCLLAKISERLPKFKLQQAPAEISLLLDDLRKYLDEQLEQAEASRAPLKMQYHKPLAIDTAAPKFESSYSLDVHYDPDRSRNETTKLRRQVNREKRGAVRELRRDAQFIAGERLREQREKDKSYSDKMKKAWGVLENDQSQLKKLDRMRIREQKGKIE